MYQERVKPLMSPVRPPFRHSGERRESSAWERPRVGTNVAPERSDAYSASMAFDTQRATRRLGDRAAEGVADVVESATSGLATEASVLELRADLTGEVRSLRAEMYRALWIQGAGIIAATAAIATALD